LIGALWVLGVEGRWLIRTDQDSPLANVSHDDFVTVRLSRNP